MPPTRDRVLVCVCLPPPVKSEVDFYSEKDFNTK
jgi:hypothetical protein